MDIKQSISALIKQSTELLKKLENDHEASLDDIDAFDKIIEESRNISTRFKSKPPTSLHNGKTESISIKLVPIEKLISKNTTEVLKESCIELSDSDSETTLQFSKPKSNDADKTSKASILKSVFSPAKENTSKKVPTEKRNSKINLKRVAVNLRRVDLNKVVASHGIELIPTINKRPTKKSSNVVRFLLY